MFSLKGNSLSVIDKCISSKYFALIITGIFFLAALFLAFTASGTGDDGDSIMHYQYARWAIVHHELFFDHWAKPLFVLIACPFAQWGVSGIKVFNMLVSSATIILTYNIASTLNIKRKGLSALFMVMSPALLVLSLSGLTEPLFALVLTISVLLYLRNFVLASLLVVSFLPFVRSEGLIMCGVFAVLLVVEKKWKFLPLLLTGHVVYSLAGYHVYCNLLWVFTRIPYARLYSVYGKGTWSHFFVHLPDIIGIPLYGLLIAGIIAAAAEVFKTKAAKPGQRRWILIYGCFSALFTGHVLFWKFGIFNSFGMLRVLIGVLPMAALIQLEGLNAILQPVKNTTLASCVIFITTLAVIAFPFMNFESSWNYKRDFCLTVGQLSSKAATDCLKTNFSTSGRTQYYYDANYVAILMNIDFFDTSVSRRVWEIWEHPPKDTGFVIWDNYYSAFEMGTDYGLPANNPRFELVKSFTMHDRRNNEKTSVLLKTRNRPSF